MNRSSLLPLLLFFTQVVFAQTEELPRYLTAAEKWMLQNNFAPGYLPEGLNSAPPNLPVRAMAEWEELQALVITWRSQPDILAEITRAAREECEVIICCNNQTTVTSAQNTLVSKGVDISSNVTFLVVNNNSIWVRDYGPNSVYANDVDSMYIVDWIYNRPRPYDDALPLKIAQYLQVPFYATTEAPTDLVHTGGNFMSDGLGTAFSSELVMDENGPDNQYGFSNHTEAEVDEIMHSYMGITRYPKMAPLPYDVIHHIDMHMKLLDEETLLVGEYPPGTADGPQIEANLQYVLNNYLSVFGTPYKVIRVPMPPDNTDDYPDQGGDYRTYANAVFVNNTVIVPFYEEQYDSTARRIWESALPGYKIVGVDCNSIIPSLGAIHCISKEVGVDDPLRIVHQELPCMYDGLPGYPVYALVQHREGISDAKVYYTTDLTQPWQSIDLAPIPFDTVPFNMWASIPPQPAGSTVYYYIQASANNGKTISRPMPAPEGYWSFCILNTVSAPEQASALMKSVYPNPASAITCIPVYSSAGTEGTLRLYNTLGQMIRQIYAGAFPAGNSNYFIDAAQLQTGAYFIEFQAGGFTAMQKLVVK